MKPTLHRIATIVLVSCYLVLAPFTHAAVAANDVILSQRNAGNTNNDPRYLAPLNNAIWTFSGGVPARTLTPAGLTSLGVNSITASASADLTLSGGVPQGVAKLGTVAQTTYIVFEGDSITDPNVNPSTWPVQLVANYAWAGAVSYFNDAVSGSSISDIVSRYAANVYPHRPSAGQRVLLYVLIGHNDLNSGTSGATAYAALASYWATAKADGFTIVAITVPPSTHFTGTVKDTERATFNQLVRQNYTNYGFLADADTVYPVPTNTTYFADGTHPTAAWHLLMASEANRVIQIFPVTYAPEGLRNLNRMMQTGPNLMQELGLSDGTLLTWPLDWKVTGKTRLGAVPVALAGYATVISPATQANLAFYDSGGVNVAALNDANSGYNSLKFVASGFTFTDGGFTTTIGITGVSVGGNLTVSGTGLQTIGGAASTVRMPGYGAGAATFDSSGNITSVSDARMKNIDRPFTTGLSALRKLTPQVYHWKKESGLNTGDVNVSLMAQDLIAAGVPEAVFTERTVDVTEPITVRDPVSGLTATRMQAKKDAAGKVLTQRVPAAAYTVSDRAVIAVLVNAIKELDARLTAAEKKIP